MYLSLYLSVYVHVHMYVSNLRALYLRVRLLPSHF